MMYGLAGDGDCFVPHNCKDALAEPRLGFLSSPPRSQHFPEDVLFERSARLLSDSSMMAAGLMSNLELTI
jgi:hypothetical protein